MSNPFYTNSIAFIPGTTADANEINAQFNAIVAAFDLVDTNLFAKAGGTITGNVTINGSLSVGGAATLNGVGNQITVSGTGSAFAVNPASAGSLNNVNIGGTTPLAGAFTTLSASGALTAGSINSTPVGNTTPSSGAFTTLSASGATTLNGAVTLGDAAADAITVTGTPTFATAASFAAGTAALPSITNTGDTNTGVFFPAADTWAVATAGSGRFRIDPAGNAGLGVTPSAWGGAVALQIAPSGSLSSANTAAGALDLGRNFYFDGTNFRYLFSGPGNASTLYEQSASGSHSWLTAPSGTAGNPITFTQAMTLTQAGNLLLGTTTDNGQRAQILGSSGSGGRALLRLDGNDGVGGGGRTTYISFAGTSNDTGSVQSEFGYIGAAKENGTQGNTQGYLAGAVNTGSGLAEAFRATSLGNFLVGTTTPSTGAFAEFTSTTGALIVPRMTTAQRDALGAVANGAIIYNTTTNKMNFREAGAWVQPTVTAA